MDSEKKRIITVLNRYSSFLNNRGNIFFTSTLIQFYITNCCANQLSFWENRQFNSYCFWSVDWSRSSFYHLCHKSFLFCHSNNKKWKLLQPSSPLILFSSSPHSTLYWFYSVTFSLFPFQHIQHYYGSIQQEATGGQHYTCCHNANCAAPSGVEWANKQRSWEFVGQVESGEGMCRQPFRSGSFFRLTEYGGKSGKER